MASVEKGEQQKYKMCARLLSNAIRDFRISNVVDCFSFAQCKYQFLPDTPKSVFRKHRSPAQSNLCKCSNEREREERVGDDGGVYNV